MPGAGEYRDKRHGIVQCCCSSFTGQCCFSALPLFILIAILFGINTKDSSEKRHTATTVTVSSGGAVAHLVLEVLQSHVDRTASLTALVSNKIWADPYSIDGFLDYAFPTFSVDTSIHRIGVTHNDVGGSYIAVSDVTIATESAVGTTSGSFGLLKPFTSHVRQQAEVQARLYKDGVLQRYGREFAQTRTSRYIALSQPQLPSYADAVSADWIHQGFLVLNDRTRDSPFADRAEWGMWLAPNHTLVHATDESRDRPSLVFIAPVAGRETQWGGQIIGRAVVRDNIFDALFDATSERVTVAYLIDWTTNIIIASSTGQTGMQWINIPQLDAFRTELFAVPGILPRVIQPDGRSPFPLAMSKIGIKFAQFYLVTFAEGNSEAMHSAAVAVVDTAFEACLALATAVRIQAQSGDLTDLQDIPHVELALGGAFESVKSSVGDLFVSARLNHSVHRFHLPTPDAPAAVVESWWPADGDIPIRRYMLTDATSDVGARMLLRNQWTDYADNAALPQTDPASALSTAELAATRSAADNTIVMTGPKDEIGRFCTIQAACRVTYVTFSSCASWPRGAVGTTDAAALSSGDVTNRSCFHLQFDTEVIAGALHGMRLDLVGLTIVAFDDGVVIAAAGEGVPFDTRYNGTARVWDVIPSYSRSNWALLQGLPYGQEKEQDGRHFVLNRVDVPATSARGNVVVLTMIEERVADSVRRETTVYAIDLVIVLCLMFFVAHFVYFVQHMRSMGRIAAIVDAAAELQTEQLPEEALRVSSTNKDVESMLISAVQLFLHMKQIRGCLPEAILESHARGIIDTTTAANANGGNGGNDRGNGNGNTQGPIATSGAAPSKDGQAAVFSNLQNQRNFNLTRQQLTFVSVMFPSTKFMTSAAGTDAFKALERASSRQGGRHWVTDSNLLCHFYFDGDFLTGALGVAKTFATLVPQCVVIVTRDEATFGLISADQDKSFAMFGPVVDNAQRIGATAREILGCGEAAAKRAEAPALSSANDKRKTAPVLIDRTTLLRSDPSSTEGAIARTVAGLRADSHVDDLKSIDEIATAVAAAQPAAVLGLQGAGSDASALIVRELLLLRQEDEVTMDEAQKLLWTGLGDAAAALVEGRRDDAGTLLRVIAQHADAANGAFVGCKWDQALQAAIAVNMRATAA